MASVPASASRDKPVSQLRLFIMPDSIPISAQLFKSALHICRGRGPVKKSALPEVDDPKVDSLAAVQPPGVANGFVGDSVRDGQELGKLKGQAAS